ncbi:MAG: type I pullulanase [Bacteroidetes bacterium]|nr:type I pullulanase [Bacteroidota bacterium]
MIPNSSAALLFLMLFLAACTGKKPEYKSYDDYPAYPDANLWVQYTPEATTFTLWSPPADAVKINFYNEGNGGEQFDSQSMEQVEKGLWDKTIHKDLSGVYYTYQVMINGQWLDETPGIYATAVGVNGKRAMVIDMTQTNPDGWNKDASPEINTPNDAIIYELHVRDITIHPNSGSSFPGKFLGLVEEDTKGPQGVSTAIDHMKELGITHVHLLPSFDHYAIDETRLDEPQFNWGYDPQNYNVPEGSYSTDPYHAETRIKEFKQMVKAFHDNGIGVILDVVYNHTGRTDNSNFNLEVPGYYYRHNADGSFSNASACGNETASERAMMRKFMIESIIFWAKEYHLDGFRFDLMGIHDIETMNEIAAALKAYNSNAFIYGEGWTAGGSPLPVNKQALKKNTWRMPQITAFSDDIRDGLKGSVFDDQSTGFVSGAPNMEASVKFGVVGSIQHGQIDYQAVNYSDSAWTIDPWQAVSYVSCHDNHTLFDKLNTSVDNASPEEIIAMDKLANAVVLTSQGIPFLHAGVEMLRTKGGEHNSYNLPDSVNQINWQWKVDHHDVFEYYQSLIALRKSHPAFCMPSGNMVRENLWFLETEPGMVGYTINGEPMGDAWTEMLVCYNANRKAKQIEVEGSWTIAVLGDQFDESGIKTVSNNIEIPAISMMVAFR